MAQHKQEMMAHRHYKNCAECGLKRYVTGLCLCALCGNNKDIVAKHRAKVKKAEPPAPTATARPETKKKAPSAEELAERAKIDWAVHLILLGCDRPEGQRGFSTAEREASKFIEAKENKPYVRGVYFEGENVVVELERQPLKLTMKKFVPRKAPAKKQKVKNECDSTDIK